MERELCCYTYFLILLDRSCDEPTANLDEDGTAQLADALAVLKSEGATILIAEHRLHWLSGIADRFVYIEDGRILWQYSPEQMLKMTEANLSLPALKVVFFALASAFSRSKPT